MNIFVNGFYGLKCSFWIFFWDVIVNVMKLLFCFVGPVQFDHERIRRPISLLEIVLPCLESASPCSIILWKANSLRISSYELSFGWLCMIWIICSFTEAMIISYALQQFLFCGIGALIDLTCSSALKNSHFTPSAHDALQPPSTSRPRSAPEPARPPVHRRGPWAGLVLRGQGGLFSFSNATESFEALKISRKLTNVPAQDSSLISLPVFLIKSMVCLLRSGQVLI